MAYKNQKKNKQHVHNLRGSGKLDRKHQRMNKKLNLRALITENEAIQRIKKQMGLI